MVEELVVPFCKRGRIALGSVAAAAVPGTTSVLNAAIGTAAVVVVMGDASTHLDLDTYRAAVLYGVDVYSFPERECLDLLPALHSRMKRWISACEADGAPPAL